MAISVGERLRALRKQRNMTLQEAADLLGITKSAIQNYECGFRIPRDTIKIEYARVFGTTVDRLFF